GELVARRDTRPVAAVTFDDGYRDVYELAFPMLSRKGIPAAVFVITDLVGTMRPPLCDRLYLLVARMFAPPSAPARLAGPRAQLEIAGAARHAAEIPGTPLACTVHLLRSIPREHVEQIIDGLEAEVGSSGDVMRGMLPMTWNMLAAMK